MEYNNSKKILLIGTLGAGKTTVSEILSEKLSFPFYSLDSLRMKNSNNSYSGEYFALYSFIEKCNNETSSILEFSGSGIHAENIFGALLQSKTDISVIWLDAPLELCIKRAKLRKNVVPAPYQWGEIEESVEDIYSNIEIRWDILKRDFCGFNFYRIETGQDDTPDKTVNKITDFLM